MLLIAERVLGEGWEKLLRKLPPWVVLTAPVEPAAGFDKADARERWVEQVTLYCGRIIRERPFRKNNLLIGFESLRMLLEWARIPWPAAGEREEEIAEAFEAFEAREIDEAGLLARVRSWVAAAQG